MQVPVEAVINLIRENLNDRYRRGFPIIKELIQNADDASATQFDFGIAPGLPKACNPLLHGPALFIVNNGNFTAEDALAINSIGLSNKPAQRSTIGKFGLGLKSVFHFCEAFFYLHSQQHALRLVNPWASAGNTSAEHDLVHPDWNSLDGADAQLMLDQLRTVLPSSAYFCLWIPLRRRRHSDKCAAITDYYPGDTNTLGQELFAPGRDETNLYQQSAALMPMLSHLRRLRHWECNDGQVYEISFQIELQPNSQRRRPAQDLSHGKPFDISGVLRLEATEARTYKDLYFYGKELVVPASSGMDTLRQSEFWPKQLLTDSATYAARVEADKAIPHAAVYFARQPTNGPSPGLYVSKAVFLPVDEPERYPLAEFGHDIHLVLHGYFFVDAGRSRIEGLDVPISNVGINNALTLRERWNARLFQVGTLPLVLPSLAGFVEQSKLTFSQIKELTKFLSQIRFYQNEGHRKAFCNVYQWVCCVAPGSRRWQLLPTSAPILPIPHPPEADPERPFAVLPNLAQIPYLVFESFPRLSANDVLDAWLPQQLASVLEIDVGFVFASATRLEYLVDFLALCPQSTLDDGRIQQRLLAIACQAMAMLGPAVLGANRSLFARFCAKLAPQQRLEVFIQRSLAGSAQTGAQLLADATDTIFKALAGTSDACLVIPILRREDAISPPSTGRLTAIATQRYLSILADCASTDNSDVFEDVRTEVALQLMRFSESTDAARSLSAHLQLFHGKIASRRPVTETRVALTDLEQSHKRGTLFRFANPPKRSGLAIELDGALAHSAVTLVRAETLTDLGLGAAGPCDAEACLQLLQQRPPLSGIEDRLDLLRQLLVQAPLKAPGIAAIRYLIHGEPSRYDDNSPLMVAADGNDIWAMLMQRALAVKNAERWRLVPAEAANELTPRSRIDLGLQTLGATGVLAMLAEFTDEKLAAIDVAGLDRSQLLQAIDRPRVLTNLSIHRTIRGESTVIRPGHTYIATDYDLPKSLAADILVLQPEPDPKLSQRYVELLHVPLLTAAKVLAIALSKSEPHRYSKEIMDAIAAHGAAVSEVLAQQLRQTKWLPIPHGEPGKAAPCEIVHIAGMEAEIARLLTANDVGYFDVLQVDAVIRAHPAWAFVCNAILPSADDAVDKLGIVLELAPEYRVGAIEKQATPDNLERFVNLWSGGNAYQLQPAAAILEQIAKYAGTDIAATLWLSLCQPIPPARSVAVLNHLRSLHGPASPNRQAQLVVWYNAYLAGAATQPDFAQGVLPQIQLLNRRGSWRHPGCLCHGYVGIDGADLLDPRQAECLQPAKTGNRSAGATASPAGVASKNVLKHSNTTDFATGVEKLRQYFAPWADYIDREPIGGFLCLLGDLPELVRLAEKYLAPRHLTETRSSLDWRPLAGMVAGATVSGAGQSIHQALAYQRFIVDILDSYTATQTVISLVGTPFNAHLETLDEIQNLVVHDKSRSSPEMLGGVQVNPLRLRQIELHHFTPQQLTNLLGETALYVLSHYYAQKPANFNQFWEDLLTSEQLDIEVAQRWILGSIPHYLPQLGLRSDPDLGPLIKEWEEIDLRELETEHGYRVRGARQAAVVNAQAEREKLQERLRAMLEADDSSHKSIQARMLAAMRRKIHDEYQYRIESVLFELFQNADDAVAEMQLAAADDSAGIDLYRSAVAELQQNALTFAHWGRAINQVLVDAERSATVGYEHDLPKMLSLQTSDKQAYSTPMPLTGKFGLGFKTVYLLSDQPQVLSGRLAFDITGGVYPRRLVAEPREKLEALRSDYTDRRQQRAMGTIFYLLPNGGAHQSVAAQQAFAAFSDLAYITAVFAHQIRQIELRSNGKTMHIAWRPGAIEGCPNLILGDLQPPGAVHTSTLTGLLLTCPDAQVLLALGARGFERLPGQVPTIWVTVPTQEACTLGFAVNAAFDLDVGRAQLARSSEKNQALAHRLIK